MCLFSMILTLRSTHKYLKHEKKMQEYLHRIEKINSLQPIQSTPDDSRKEKRRVKKANRKIERAKEIVNK